MNTIGVKVTKAEIELLKRLQRTDMSKFIKLMKHLQKNAKPVPMSGFPQPYPQSNPNLTPNPFAIDLNAIKNNTLQMIKQIGDLGVISVKSKDILTVKLVITRLDDLDKLTRNHHPITQQAFLPEIIIQKKRITDALKELGLSI